MLLFISFEEFYVKIYVGIEVWYKDEVLKTEIFMDSIIRVYWFRSYTRILGSIFFIRFYPRVSGLFIYDLTPDFYINPYRGQTMRGDWILKRCWEMRKMIIKKRSG